MNSFSYEVNRSIEQHRNQNTDETDDVDESINETGY